MKKIGAWKNPLEFLIFWKKYFEQKEPTKVKLLQSVEMYADQNNFQKGTAQHKQSASKPMSILEVV